MREREMGASCMTKKHGCTVLHLHASRKPRNTEARKTSQIARTAYRFEAVRPTEYGRQLENTIRHGAREVPCVCSPTNANQRLKFGPAVCPAVQTR